MGKAIDFIHLQSKKKNEEKSNQSAEDDKCPFHRILLFAMHLHCVGHIFPKWMVDVLTLFNDSELKSCHEAASLGQQQRKLFLDTVCECKEPDSFIYVDTNASIETSVHSNWALVNVSTPNAKYCN